MREARVTRLAFTSRLVTREHYTLIRQRCSFLWVGANRSPLLKSSESLNEVSLCDYRKA